MRINKSLIIEQLFEQYYISMVLFAKNYIPDTDDCKDIVQEIFLTLIESSDTLEPVENYKAYLYQTVRNKCLKHIRHKQVVGKYTTTEEQKNEQDDSFYEQILEQEVYGLLMTEIAGLPEQCRNVFILALEGKSNQEIADTLHVGVETVKSHKKTGKKILYSRLKNSILFSLLQSLMYL